VSSEPTELLHDLFTHKGFGDKGQRIYQTLREAESPMTATELSRLVQCCERTARRKLTDMALCGLVEKVDGTSAWRALARDIDEVARELGAAGHRAKLKSLHQIERELDAKHRSEYLARTAHRGHSEAPLDRRLSPSNTAAGNSPLPSSAARAERSSRPSWEGGPFE
jgi:hypothetical protein